MPKPRRARKNASSLSARTWSICCPGCGKFSLNRSDAPSLQKPANHISRQGLWRLCSRAGEQAGVKFWPHCGRHTHATHAYVNTRDPKLIQSTLGHAGIGTTMQLYVDEAHGDSSAKHLS